MRIRNDHPRRGWMIWDSWRERSYIDRGWATEQEAEAELASLLRPYPERHLWRTILVVRRVGV